MKPISLVDRIKEEKNRGGWEDHHVMFVIATYLVEKGMDYSFLSFLRQKVEDSIDGNPEELSV